MRKSLPLFRLALYTLCALSLFSLRAYGQDHEGKNDHPNGIVQDWSGRHTVYPRFGPIRTLIALQNDPRAIRSWQESLRRDWRIDRWPRRFRDQQLGLHRDWSIPLGGGTTAKSMYPAKFTFDPNAAANCATDFIVYPVNATGSSSQPNIVGFNNLYSGTAGSTGICNAPSGGRTAGANDDGVSATTIFSYDITAAGGQVSTSPALSLDGTKIAFVETAASTTAHFHVLAWKSGDGVAANLQTVTSPKQITSGFATTAPAAGSGTVTDLALGSTSDTLSSPFVDYVKDVAYVGNDTGTLYRIKNVFCTVSCTVGVTAAPSLDASWGGTGAVATGCSGLLTGPVEDPGTGHILVGCSDGKLYGFTSAGAPLATPSLVVGDGSTYGGIVDPPMVDGVNGFAYVASMSGFSTSGTPVMVQVKTDLTSPVTATLGPGASFNLHAPAFNNAYLTGSGTPLLYNVAASTTPTNEFTVYGAGFNGSYVMNSGTPTNQTTFTLGVFEISPMTEFYNGTEDRLFESTVGAGGSIASFNINSFPSGVENAVFEGSGTTGIVVDNASASAQADSIYFGVLGSNTAVKLTQSGLQ